MGARTTARESALQMLFAIDATEADVDDVIRDYWRETPGDAEGRAFADALVRGVVRSLSEIDRLITTASAHWRVERMTRVDRNVLRVGAYELARCPEVPRPVAIDEAVELAKRFGTEESSSFVNGVLDRIAEDCGRPNDGQAS
ncbi:MAG TPA: transcription antitermination factor NusB [Polyangiaceae bacterium]|nr:transcription antitermination factor NusB [Polyangiaceae bacterium]